MTITVNHHIHFHGQEEIIHLLKKIIMTNNELKAGLDDLKTKVDAIQTGGGATTGDSTVTPEVETSFNDLKAAIDAKGTPQP